MGGRVLRNRGGGKAEYNTYKRIKDSFKKKNVNYGTIIFHDDDNTQQIAEIITVGDEYNIKFKDSNTDKNNYGVFPRSYINNNMPINTIFYYNSSSFFTKIETKFRNIKLRVNTQQTTPSETPVSPEVKSTDVTDVPQLTSIEQRVEKLENIALRIKNIIIDFTPSNIQQNT